MQGRFYKLDRTGHMTGSRLNRHLVDPIYGGFLTRLLSLCLCVSLSPPLPRISAVLVEFLKQVYASSHNSGNARLASEVDPLAFSTDDSRSLASSKACCLPLGFFQLKRGGELTTGDLSRAAKLCRWHRS
ncbi:hypothetical protein M5K25_010849 [Dendrobium thyrsiflorum]|uniref:Uncharacterized protein n=1 Tax=Dendrobium thyrsiflorum TaxID=117978 RepID=A0ABD0V1K2_DENTH